MDSGSFVGPHSLEKFPHPRRLRSGAAHVTFRSRMRLTTLMSIQGTCGTPRADLYWLKAPMEPRRAARKISRNRGDPQRVTGAGAVVSEKIQIP